MENSWLFLSNDNYNGPAFKVQKSTFPSRVRRQLDEGISIMTTKSCFIRGSLCGAVGWQVCATFPKSLHRLGEDTRAEAEWIQSILWLVPVVESRRILSPDTQIKVCSFHQRQVSDTKGKSDDVSVFKEIGRKTDSFFFFFSPVEGSQNICLTAVMNVVASCRWWKVKLFWVQQKKIIIKKLFKKKGHIHTTECISTSVWWWMEAASGSCDNLPWSLCVSL